MIEINLFSIVCSQQPPEQRLSSCDHQRLLALSTISNPEVRGYTALKMSHFCDIHNYKLYFLFVFFVVGILHNRPTHCSSTNEVQLSMSHFKNVFIFKTVCCFSSISQLCSTLCCAVTESRQNNMKLTKLLKGRGL